MWDRTNIFTNDVPSHGTIYICNFGNKPFNHKQFAAAAGITRSGDKAKLPHILSIFVGQGIIQEISRGKYKAIVNEITKMNTYGLSGSACQAWVAQAYADAYNSIKNS